MPIKREDFEKGRVVSETEKATLQFLERYRDQAFTAEEILLGLGYIRGQNFWSDMASMLTLQTLLDTLVREGKVSVRQVTDAVKTENYFAAK